MAGGVEDVVRFLEEGRSRGQVALVGLDLPDVVRDRRGTHHVADPLPRLFAAAVDLERLLPPALVIRVDAQVVQDVGLAEQVAELFVDREREAAEGSPVGTA